MAVPDRSTNQPTPEELKRLYRISDKKTAAPRHMAGPTEEPGATTDIDDELVRRERIKNDDAEQDIRLKRITLDRLFLLLTAETTLIFLCAFLQATFWFGFRLEEWSFKVLTTATILQITGMLYVAVRYLFPPKGGRA